MGHRVPSSDFRGSRWVLDPDDFAIGPEGPDPPPSDLVAESIWSGIVDAPTDAGIRTSDHHGSQLRLQHELWGGLFDIAEQLQQGPLYDAVLDAADEVQAATFESLHGYYRPALSSLRTAMDVLLTGLCCELAPTRPEVAKYLAAPESFEISFGMACDLAVKASIVTSLEGELKAAVGDTFFSQKGMTPGEGWVRRLYGMLSKYSHSRSGRTSVSIWNSNGPVYVPSAFDRITLLFVEVVAMMCLLVKLGRSAFQLPIYFADNVFTSPQIRPPAVVNEARRLLWSRDLQ